MENTNETPLTTKKGTFPATVVKVIKNQQLAINRGLSHGIKEGQRMLVYYLSSEEIQDPHTGEYLGHLEIVKGTGKIINVQEKIAILESDKIQYKKIRLPAWIRSGDPRVSFEQIIEEPDILPFDDPQVGDMVKPI